MVTVGHDKKWNVRELVPNCKCPFEESSFEEKMLVAIGTYTPKGLVGSLLSLERVKYVLMQNGKQPKEGRD